MVNRKLSISFAESATAGHLVAAFAEVPNAGKFLKGGIVCYDSCIKEDLLRIPPGLLAQYTAESLPVTIEMANAIAKLIKSDIQIAVTGLLTAGGSETSAKPAGTMFIAIRIAGKLQHGQQLLFKGTPLQLVKQTLDYAIASLLSLLGT